MAMTNDELQELRKKRNWIEFTVDEYMKLIQFKDRTESGNEGDIFRYNKDITPVVDSLAYVMKAASVIIKENGLPKIIYTLEMCYIK